MIDWDRIFELREEVGNESFSEIIEIFVDEVRDAIDVLRNKVGFDSLEADLHFLKGSALNLGFAAFASLCETGEWMASQGKAEEVDIAAIVASFEMCLAEFLDGLPARMAA